MTLKNNWFFKYKLTPDAYLVGKLTPVPDIEFISDGKNDMEKLIGFVIQIKDSTFTKAREISDVKATRLTNYISLSQNRTFSASIKNHWPDVRDGGKALGVYSTVTADIIISTDIKFSSENVSLLLNEDSLFNQQIAHYCRGLKAYEDNDAIIMLKEFYQVFEEKWIKRENPHFKLIRDLLSHITVNNEDIRNIKSKYPKFDFNPEPGEFYLDLTLNNNIVELRKIANELMNIASKYLNTKKDEFL